MSWNDQVTLKFSRKIIMKVTTYLKERIMEKVNVHLIAHYKI